MVMFTRRTGSGFFRLRHARQLDADIARDRLSTRVQTLELRAFKVRDGWFVGVPVTPEEVAQFILTGQTTREVP